MLRYLSSCFIDVHVLLLLLLLLLFVLHYYSSCFDVAPPTLLLVLMFHCSCFAIVPTSLHCCSCLRFIAPLASLLMLLCSSSFMHRYYVVLHCSIAFPSTFLPLVTLLFLCASCFVAPLPKLVFLPPFLFFAMYWIFRIVWRKLKSIQANNQFLLFFTCFFFKIFGFHSLICFFILFYFFLFFSLFYLVLIELFYSFVILQGFLEGVLENFFFFFFFPWL